MKALLAIPALLVAWTVCAFDSDGWEARRRAASDEAARLKGEYAKCVAALQTPGENMIIPFENHPDGSIRAQVAAERVQIFLDTGYVWASGVTLSEFATNGTESATVTAQRCVADRTRKCGWAVGRAKADYRLTELEGDGVYFSLAEEYVMIESNATIRSRDVRLGALPGGAKREAGPRAAPEATVRARRADYDRRAGVVMFDGGVEVDDGTYRMSADAAYVFLDGTNALKRIVALGGVRVADGTREGTCATATYSKAASKVVMYGDGTNVVARLVDNGARRSEVEGRRITFRVDEEQVEVEDSCMLFETGETDRERFLR